VLEGVVIGAGNRGADAYVPYLERHPEEARIVAVAEPDRARREAFARRHRLGPERCFDDYRALLAADRMADFVIIATPDDLHFEPARLALEKGHHVLLEKPMAIVEDECEALVEAADRAGRILQVCHVLRYAPLFEGIHRAIREGRIGDVVAIQHSENVSTWHYAHSYCRGHWRNSTRSSPLILAKSCHDLDLLYWLAGAEPEALHSCARETELCARNRPTGAPDRCIDGCRHSAECPYDAVSMYLDSRPLGIDLAKTRRAGARGAVVRRLVALRDALTRSSWNRVSEAARWRDWPVSTITRTTTRAGIEHALRTTRYGLCVYAVGDNDQPSAQTVGIRFENGVLANFTLHGHSYREGREIRVDGTRGSLVGRFHLLEQWLEVHDHKTGHVVEQRFRGDASGHGGGDHRLFAGFLSSLRGDADPLTSARQSLTSHRMAFAAHRSSRSGAEVRFGDSEQAETPTCDLAARARGPA
jgi:predicted dehydrogenase